MAFQYVNLTFITCSLGWCRRNEYLWLSQRRGSYKTSVRPLSVACYNLNDETWSHDTPIPMGRSGACSAVDPHTGTVCIALLSVATSICLSLSV
jgi:hypothetical protein